MLQNWTFLLRRGNLCKEPWIPHSVLFVGRIYYIQKCMSAIKVWLLTAAENRLEVCISTPAASPHIQGQQSLKTESLLSVMAVMTSSTPCVCTVKVVHTLQREEESLIVRMIRSYVVFSTKKKFTQFSDAPKHCDAAQLKAQNWILCHSNIFL